MLWKRWQKQQQVQRQQKQQQYHQQQSPYPLKVSRCPPREKTPNSVRDVSARMQLYDGRRLCASRECCRLFAPGHGDYCRKKCQVWVCMRESVCV
ncbi:hypothetical protein FACS189472_10820 [Alphaproteobacteria bacterium]|nr:hypothetical protein FACS189472_10820 [Alphaproteobacteria bacterium]